MQVLAKQQEPLCLDCFQFSLGRTVRHTIRTKCLIEAGDNVLVALSGGSSSLALLLLLQEICKSKQHAARHGQVWSTVLADLKGLRKPALQLWDGLSVQCTLSLLRCMQPEAGQELICSVVIQETFRLGALHIDETVAYSNSQAMAQQRTQAVRSTVPDIDESTPFHSVLLEDALPSDEQDVEVPSTKGSRQRLKDVLLVRSP